MGALPRRTLLLTSHSQLPFHTLGSSKAKGWAGSSLGLWASHRLALPGMSSTPSSWPSRLLALLSGSFPWEPFPDTSFSAMLAPRPGLINMLSDGSVYTSNRQSPWREGEALALGSFSSQCLNPQSERLKPEGHSLIHVRSRGGCGCQVCTAAWQRQDSGKEALPPGSLTISVDPLTAQGGEHCYPCFANEGTS